MNEIDKLCGAISSPQAPQKIPVRSQRDSWDQYFIKIAKQVATRSTCDRMHVGAVLVRNRQIISTGYNGSLPGLSHCDDRGHLIIDGHCVRVVHAEANAIAQAATYGIPVEGSTIYTTISPCFLCFKLLVSARVARIVYETYYPDTRESAAAEAGITVEACGIELEQVGEW